MLALCHYFSCHLIKFKKSPLLQSQFQLLLSSVDKFGACQTNALVNMTKLFIFFVFLFSDIAKLLVTPVREAWKISFLQRWLPVQYIVCSAKITRN